MVRWKSKSIEDNLSLCDRVAASMLYSFVSWHLYCVFFFRCPYFDSVVASFANISCPIHFYFFAQITLSRCLQYSHIFDNIFYLPRLVKGVSSLFLSVTQRRTLFLFALAEILGSRLYHFSPDHKMITHKIIFFHSSCVPLTHDVRGLRGDGEDLYSLLAEQNSEP